MAGSLTIAGGRNAGWPWLTAELLAAAACPGDRSMAAHAGAWEAAAAACAAAVTASVGAQAGVVVPAAVAAAAAEVEAVGVAAVAAAVARASSQVIRSLSSGSDGLAKGIPRTTTQLTMGQRGGKRCKWSA